MLLDPSSQGPGRPDGCRVPFRNFNMATELGTFVIFVLYLACLMAVAEKRLPPFPALQQISFDTSVQYRSAE
eukprot:s6_g36.t1